MPISVLWGIRPNFFGLSPCVRQVAYALRTRPPVATIKSKLFNVLPLDLHVLGLPLAFILSQDMILQKFDPMILDVLYPNLLYDSLYYKM